jgi:hypothetical protein
MALHLLAALLNPPCFSCRRTCASRSSGSNVRTTVPVVPAVGTIWDGNGRTGDGYGAGLRHGSAAWPSRSRWRGSHCAKREAI